MCLCVCLCICLCVCVCSEPLVASEASELSVNSLQPHPLPMPAYGGYYAPLCQYLPTTGNLPTPPYQRSATVISCSVSSDNVPDVHASSVVVCCCMLHSQPISIVMYYYCMTVYSMCLTCYNLSHICLSVHYTGGSVKNS